MSLENRDYMRTPSRAYSAALPKPMSIVTILIIVNVVVFVLVNLMHMNTLGNLGVMQTSLVMKGQVWRLITSQYLHAGVMHIALNMYGLYLFGRLVATRWSPGKFFTIYTLAGILGNVFYAILVSTGWFDDKPMVGASGAVLGIMGACAVMFPRLEIIVFPIFLPLEIYKVVIVLGGMFLMYILTKGDNAGGHAAHFAGLLFGAFYAWRGDRWFTNAGWKEEFNRQRQQIEYPSPMDNIPIPKDPGVGHMVDAAEVDRILKKISETGIGSLTVEEKRALEQASRNQTRKH